MAGFIFDMDGTLLDTIHVWHEAEQNILSEAGIALTKEERDQLNTLTLDEAAEWFHERFGLFANGAQVADAITQHMLSYYGTRAKANPGALDFVRAISQAGAPMCVLSSSPQSFLQTGLPTAGFKEFFPDDQLIISADDMGLTKRDPRTFHHVCDLLGTSLSETWLFDDSWYALACAQGEGVRCVGVFSSDGCGTHEELGRYSNLVIDDFTQVNPADFL